MSAGKGFYFSLSRTDELPTKHPQSIVYMRCCMLAATIVKRIRETSGGLHTTFGGLAKYRLAEC